jgi:hypothetical protein
LDAHFNAVRDIIQIFFTAAIGVLVFSVTFAEKIIGPSNPGERLPKIILGSAWIFLLAGVSSGVLVLLALNDAVFESAGDPRKFYSHLDLVHRLTMFAGVYLVVALYLLVFSAGLAIMHKFRS